MRFGPLSLSSVPSACFLSFTYFHGTVKRSRSAIREYRDKFE